ncbi:MAG TPA: signal recognition particle protein [Chloroflexota bacterium]|jgi:signal recognition particle subunit SRP54|nr:signal recognition particle protein [Chloroflexota bacterium]
MFESLSDKLQEVFSRLGRKGRLDERDVDEALKEVRQALLGADVNFKVVKAFMARVRERAVGHEVLQSLTPAQQVIKIVHDELLALLGEPSRLTPAPQPPTVVMLVGLQGSGKTTTAAKLALALRKQGPRSLLVAADPYRPAAVAQLQTLGKQLDVPVYADERRKPPELAQDAIKYARQQNLAYVILDTAGRLVIAEDLMRELEEIKRRVQPHEVLLVADAMTGQDAVRVAEEFHKRVGLTGLILTKLDGDARGGAALSIREVTGVPIKYLGVGEKLDALEPFHPDRLASRILGMGDVLSLIERAQQTIDQQHALEMQRKVKTGSFDLNDYLKSLQQLRNMGPLEQLLDMIPGMGKLLREQRLPAIQEKDLKRVEAIILSMTPYERAHPEIIGASRKRRIARGSGTTTADVNQLLNTFKQMQQLMRQMSGAKTPRHFKGLLPGATGDLRGLPGGASLKKRPYMVPPGRRGR